MNRGFLGLYSPLVGKWGLFGAATAAGSYLGNEPSGLAIDFTENSALVRGHTTNFSGQPVDLLTYTAPSPKMTYGSDGVLRYARHNLLTYSEDFANAAWGSYNNNTITTNQIASPTGAITADKITENSATSTHHTAQTAAIFAVGARTVCSVYAKAGERNWLYFTGFNDSNLGAWFNLSTGSVGTRQSLNIAASIEDAGDGWYRCSITFAPTKANPYIGLAIAQSDNTSSYLGDGSSGLYIWGAQVQLAPTNSTTYLPTTSAARYDLPYDYDPVTLAAKGVLIEEQRTNLRTYSQQFDNVAWTKSNTTATADQATAPDGTLTADLLAENSATSEHYLQGTVLSLTGSYVASVYAKLKPGSTRYLYIGERSTTGTQVIFDLVNGTAASGGTIRNVGNGWYRCSLNGITLTAQNYGFRIGLDDDGSAASYNYSGDGTSGVYIWGAQLEAGSYATSYIPTVASQVTRAADAISLAGSMFPWSQTAGMFAVETSSISATAGTNHGVDLLINSSNKVSIRNGMMLMTSSGATQFSLSPAGIGASTSVQKRIVTWAENDAAATVDGNNVATDTSVTLFAGTPELRLSVDNTGFYPNGHIAKLKYLPRRVTNAELQAMAA
jgi:hypothetical protein